MQARRYPIELSQIGLQTGAREFDKLKAGVSLDRIATNMYRLRCHIDVLKYQMSRHSVQTTPI